MTGRAVMAGIDIESTGGCAIGHECAQKVRENRADLRYWRRFGHFDQAIRADDDFELAVTPASSTTA